MGKGSHLQVDGKLSLVQSARTLGGGGGNQTKTDWKQVHHVALVLKKFEILLFRRVKDSDTCCFLTLNNEN